MKYEAYVINLDEYSDIGTPWIGLYVNSKTITYFDSFGVKHIPKEIKKFINNKNIIANIFRIQAYDSAMCDSATGGSISIASFATVIGIPVGIASASLSLTFSFSTGLVKKLLKMTKNKKRSIIKLFC